MPFVPGDPWPSGMPGGAASPRWGGYVRLWVRAALAAGNVFHLGAHDYDRLDAGNVLGGAPVALARAEFADRLWIDVTCDVLDLEVAGGASSSAGIFSKADAATAQVTLADPHGIYDPLNGHGPYAYGGRSRLVPGTPLEVFAETIDDPAAASPSATRYFLFTGTVDSWGEEWTPTPSKRRAVVVASDATKQWVRYDRPEQPPVGAGDTTAARISRLVDYYDWAGTLEAWPTSAVTLQATTLAAAGWELLNRTTDDELGFVFFTPAGALRWVGRDAWFTFSDPALALGCAEAVDGLEAYDVIVEASPTALDLQIRNAVYAARSGGATATATVPASIDRYGWYDYKRTDLGLEHDAQAGEWANVVVTLYAFPQIGLEDVTLRPDVAPDSWAAWAAVLGLEWITDLVRVVWAPPDRPADVIDGLSRVVGVTHTVTRTEWEVEWQLIDASTLAYAGVVFTLGPHTNDRLDAGFVLGLTAPV
jgi:hypothetical protein